VICIKHFWGFKVGGFLIGKAPGGFLGGPKLRGKGWGPQISPGEKISPLGEGIFLTFFNLLISFKNLGRKKEEV